MPRVICELPNAALEINGVAFEKMEDGRILSADVEQEIADFFLSIPGYLADGEVPLVIDKDTAPPAAPKSGSRKSGKTPAAPAVDPAAVAAAATAEAEAAATAATAAAEAEAAEATAATEAEAAAAGESGEDQPPADDVF